MKISSTSVIMERQDVDSGGKSSGTMDYHACQQFRLADDVRLVPGKKEWAIYKLDEHKIIRVTPAEGLHIQSGELSTSAIRQLTAAGIYVMGKEGDSPARPPSEVSENRKSSEVPFRSAWLELTDACNLSCSHCYMNAGRACGKAKVDWYAVLEYLSFHKCKQAILIGGEPLCHPHFLEYVEFAKHISSKMRLCVVTNGTLWTDRLLGRMKELDVFLKFSLLGSTPDRHDGLTGVKGSFDAVIKAIDSAIRLGVRLEIATTLLPEGEETRESISHFISERFGCVKHSTASVRPQGRQGQCGNIADVCSEDKLAVHVSSPFFDLARRQHPCLHGKVVFTNSGLVHPCIMSRFEAMKIDDVLKRDPTEVFQRWWTLTKDKIEGCRDCALRYACFDCRGFASSLIGPPCNCRLAVELLHEDVATNVGRPPIR